MVHPPSSIFLRGLFCARLVCQGAESWCVGRTLHRHCSLKINRPLRTLPTAAQGCRDLPAPRPGTPHHTKVLTGQGKKHGCSITTQKAKLLKAKGGFRPELISEFSQLNYLWVIIGHKGAWVTKNVCFSEFCRIQCKIFKVIPRCWAGCPITFLFQ